MVVLRDKRDNQDNQDQKGHKFDIILCWIHNYIKKKINMVKVHPENSEKKYELYYFMRNVACGVILCLCIWIGMIVIIFYSECDEKHIIDGSN